MGQLILLYNFPDTYEEMWTDHNVPQPPNRRTERESWDTDLAEIGATATECWSFPDALVLGIRHHQKPRTLKDDRVLYELAPAVQAAEKVNRRLIRELPSHGSTNGRQSISAPLKELVRLGQTDLDDLNAQLRKNKTDVMKYIEMALQAT